MEEPRYDFTGDRLLLFIGNDGADEAQYKLDIIGGSLNGPIDKRPKCAVLLARKKDASSSNHIVIRNLNIDGAYGKAGIICAGAECVSIQDTISHSLTSPALLVCNSFEGSGLSTMQKFEYVNGELAADSTPIVVIEQQRKIISDIVFRGVEFTQNGTASSAIQIITDFGAEALEIDNIVFDCCRFECESASRLIEILGNNKVSVNFISFRDCSIDCSGPVIYAPGMSLGVITFDSTRWSGRLNATFTSMVVAKSCYELNVRSCGYMRAPQFTLVENQAKVVNVKH